MASEGMGVFDSLNLISKMVLSNFMKQNNLPQAEVPDNVCVSAES